MVRQFRRLVNCLNLKGILNMGAKLDLRDATTVWFQKSKRVVKTIKEWDRAFNAFFNIYLQQQHH